MDDSFTSGGLTDGEITRVVNRYIGVSHGYLGLPESNRFTYSSHADFYAEYCEIDVDLSQHQGTTREKFMKVLNSLPPRDQAKVLRGVIERFPLGEGPSTRSSAHAELLRMIERLELAPLVAHPTPQATGEVVLRAIRDAEVLIATSGPTSAVDRVHTAIHGHLQVLCERVGVAYGADDSMVALLKKLRAANLNLQDLGPRAQDVERVLNACGSILDALLPFRNRASVAHPNRELLGEAEARLAINAGWTVLDYLDAKLSCPPGE
jgi:hypothetical protein